MQTLKIRNGYQKCCRTFNKYKFSHLVKPRVLKVWFLTWTVSKDICSLLVWDHIILAQSLIQLYLIYLVPFTLILDTTKNSDCVVSKPHKTAKYDHLWLFSRNKLDSFLQYLDISFEVFCGKFTVHINLSTKYCSEILRENKFIKWPLFSVKISITYWSQTIP